MNELIYYPNCSMGGVTTVIRGRAIAQTSRRFDAVFVEDRGGKRAFDDLPNVRSLVIRKDRKGHALNYMVERFGYEQVSVLSDPSAVDDLAGKVESLRYEFHSSNLDIIKSEVGKLTFDAIDEIAAPTEFMAQQISDLLPSAQRRKLGVVPNLIDEHTFSESGPSDFYVETVTPALRDARPLVWVGRFDRGKGPRHFVRLLASLPDDYVGVMVVSMEKDPARVSDILSEAAVMGVMDRISIHANLPQADLAKLYRWARDRNGWAVSTSLLESFGYFVAEAAACGLPVAAFHLPVWREHKAQELIHSVPIGSVHHLAELIRSGAPRAHQSLVI